MQSPSENIQLGENLAKADRLFRAAISGFCSLSAPARRDALRLDELAMPLVPLVGEDTLRFAAAALSGCEIAPPALMRRLCDMPIPVSAPLLVGARALADIDLIGIIGRNGLEHARAVAQRRSLNPNIISLIRALGLAGVLQQAEEKHAAERAALPAPVVAAVTTAARLPEPAVAMPAEASVEPAVARTPVASTPASAATVPVIPADSTRQAVNRLLAAAGRAQAYIERKVEYTAAPAPLTAVAATASGAAEDSARDRLRQMMLPSGKPVADPAPVEDWAAARSAYPRLVATGLSGKAALFQTALADGLELDFATAAAILDATSDESLATCLKAIGLDTSEAFFVAALACPPRYATTAAIRAFVDTYRHADAEAARAAVRRWRGEETPLKPANSQAEPVQERRLLRA